MNQSDTDKINDHLRRLVSILLKVDEDLVQSKVDVIPSPSQTGGYICHMQVMIDGKEPTKRQERAIIFAVQRYGFPGIRVTSLHIPAKA